MKFVKTLLYIILPIEFVFLSLKLANIIDWNWSMVFAPLWIPMTLVMALFIVCLVLGYYNVIKFGLDIDIKPPQRDKDGEES